MKEEELEKGNVFTNRNGDVFIKVDDSTCAYIGNIQKSKTDKTLLFPLLDQNNVEVIGNFDTSCINRNYLN